MFSASLSPSPILVAICLALTAASAPAAAAAAPVHIDRSFGKGGVSFPSIGPRYGGLWFSEVSEQEDGRILATLSPAVNEGTTLVHRYLANGEEDPSFTPQPPPADRGDVKATLADGRYLVAVNEYSSGRLERHFPDGSLDGSFGTGTDGLSDEVPAPIRKIVPLASGGIVAVGVTPGTTGLHGGGTPSEVVVARLTEDGLTVASFGTAGAVRFITDLGVANSDLVTALERPEDGVLVVANTSQELSGNTDSALVALTGSGAPDPSFGTDGIVDPGFQVQLARGAGGGTVDLAGTEWSSARWCCGDFRITRYTATGQPDPGFGAGSGTATADFGGNDRLQDALWAADGSILLAGTTTVTSEHCVIFSACWEMPALARFTANGQPDSSFGKGGKAALERLRTGGSGTTGNARVHLSARLGGGAFVAGSSGPRAFLSSLDDSGAPDAGFAAEGFLIERLPRTPSGQTSGVAVDRRGRVLVFGATTSGGTSPIGGGAVIRYRRNGAVDRDYGRNGVASVEVSDGDPSAIAVDRAGRAVVAGNAGMARLTRNGRPDPSFGQRGFRQLPSGLHPRAIAVLRNGKILIAGGYGNLRPKAVVVRLLPNGKLDRGFRGSGIDLIDCQHGRSCEARGLAVQGNGHILLAGYVSPRRTKRRWETSAVALARLRPNGRLDASFGSRGWATTHLGEHSGAYDVALQDGKVLATGWSGGGKRSKAVVLRYSPSGHLDRGFGTAGVARAAVSPLRLAEAFSGRATLLRNRHRILVIRSAAGTPVLAFARNGRRQRFPGEKSKVAPGRLLNSYLPPSPSGALRKGKLVITWNKVTASGQGGITTRIALQRLAVR